VPGEGLHGVLLEVAYDGTDFHGWASQKGARTVEETLRGAVSALDPRCTEVRGASRTDAGVHADAQAAAFDTETTIPPRGWVLGLNQHLPEDVAVRVAQTVPAGFAPRFAARGKRYRYRLLLDDVRDPRWRTRAWRLPELDVTAMTAEATAVLGTHDFASFRSSADERPNTVRTLTRVDVERETDSRLVSVVVEGDAFMHNMVRILVGTMADVGRGRLPRGAMAVALAAHDRRSAGTTAPAHGLVLERVNLPLDEASTDRWPR
jgi:tRNA pseudouridine38-40 synthase